MKFNNEGISETIIEDGSHNIANIWIKEANDGKMYVTGFYDQPNEEDNNIDGVFLYRLDEENQVTESSYHDVPAILFDQYKEARANWSKKEATESRRNADITALDFERFFIDDIYVEEDGSVLIMAEQYYNVIRSTESSSTNIHNYRDILVAKINKSGDLEWMKKLPKRQEGWDRKESLSYNHRYIDGVHHFIFADSRENSEHGMNDIPNVYRWNHSGILTDYRVSQDGSVSKTPIADLEKILMQGKKKPSGTYKFSREAMVETSNGYLFEVYKKSGEDVMIHLNIED